MIINIVVDVVVTTSLEKDLKEARTHNKMGIRLHHKSVEKKHCTTPIWTEFKGPIQDYGDTESLEQMWAHRTRKMTPFI